MCFMFHFLCKLKLNSAVYVPNCRESELFYLIKRIIRELEVIRKKNVTSEEVSVKSYISLQDI